MSLHSRHRRHAGKIVRRRRLLEMQAAAPASARTSMHLLMWRALMASAQWRAVAGAARYGAAYHVQQHPPRP